MLKNKVRVLKSQTIILSTLCMLLSGCATMFAPGSDQVTIKTYPAGANVPAGAGEKAHAGEAITIAAVGDIMMGSDYPEAKLPPRDGEGIFEAVKQAFSGQDIVFGNLEGPLLEGGRSTKCEKLSRCFAFRTPTRYVRYLREAEFTTVSVANNHASDFGDEGRESTLRTLASAGIQAAGGKAVARFTIKGKKIALAGFSYSTPSRYSFSLLDIPEAVRIVRDLKKENDLVIVSFHGGAEGETAQHLTGKAEVFMGEERGDEMSFAHAVVDAGADLVIGHGPHVLRALQVYRGKLIVYSLGNFLGYERFNINGPSGRSIVLQARLDAETGDFLGGTLVPVRLVNEGIPEPDLERQAVDLIKSLTRQDVPRSGIVISDDGTIAPGGEKEKQ
jgi:poly-gamma-glutamate capsule biosynthesis protein CapA/YwtB (metallophosphatase superfamily)